MNLQELTALDRERRVQQAYAKYQIFLEEIKALNVEIDFQMSETRLRGRIWHVDFVARP